MPSGTEFQVEELSCENACSPNVVHSCGRELSIDEVKDD